VRRGLDKPLLLVVVGDTPLDLVVDHTMSFDSLLSLATPERLLQARGIVPDDWTGRAAVLADVFSTVGALRMAWKRADRGVVRVEGGVQSEQTPIENTLYRRLFTLGDFATWPRWRYRVSGKKRSHTVMVDPVAHPDPRRALETALQQPLDLFELVPNGAAVARKRAARRNKSPPISQPAEAILLHPGAVFPPAPGIVSDIFGTDRRDPTAPPLPIAPLQVRIGGNRLVRHWSGARGEQPISIRSAVRASRPAVSASYAFLE
jgi:hypothetical protein